MTIHAGRRTLVGVVLAIGLAATLQVAAPTSRADAAGEPAWTGGVSLYRDGSFTTQRSWLWCTAAGVQIVRNIVDHKADHTTAGQRRYFDWMRARNRYDLPLSAGVDAAGWTAGLRHFVDDRYRLVASKSFDAALRSAVTRMRLTRLPVALTVSHGNHGWILTGFRATADPAATSDFTVTSVRVTGPLYGLQSKNGYDMAPNTKLTTAQLKRFFTPWKYAPMPMVWDGRYVSIQPVPTTGKPAATAKPRVAAPAASPSGSGAALAPLGSPTVSEADSSDIPPTTSPASASDAGHQVAVAVPGDLGPPSPASAEEPAAAASSSSAPAAVTGAIALMLFSGLAVATLIVRRGRRPGPG